MLLNAIFIILIQEYLRFSFDTYESRTIDIASLQISQWNLLHSFKYSLVSISEIFMFDEVKRY